MEWIEILIRIDRRIEEKVIAILYDIGVKGISIEDPEDLRNIEQDKKDWDYIDEKYIKKALEKFKDDRINIKIYFSQEDEVEEKLECFKDNLRNMSIGEDQYELKSNRVKEEDWAENWKKYYKPTRVGKNIVIKPSWEEYKKEDGDIIIEIDPGMAFGTGTHETTYLCIEALEEKLRKNDKVYDIGTGSGILSIVAASLGASKVIGVDLDYNAVKVARENVSASKLTDKIKILQGDLLENLEEKGDIVVANIIAEIIRDMTRDIYKYLKPGGIFIGSGIILEKLDLVTDELLRNDFEILEIKKKNSWACIVSKLKEED